MYWKVCYKKSDDNQDVYTSIKQIEESNNTTLKVEFPAVVPDNTHCYYFAKFNAFEFDVLHFDGIDTLAEIFVNGNKITTTETNFRQYEVSEGIKEGENEVLLYVHPKFARKNVIRDISLRRRKKCAVKKCTFDIKELDQESENAKICVSAETFIREDSLHDFNKITYVATIKDDKKQYTTEGEIIGGRMNAFIEIPRARIWWPKNYGKSFLYDAQFAIYDGNKLLDVYDQKLALFTKDISVGNTLINDKKVSLCGPLVTELTNALQTAEKLSSTGCNAVYFPKNFTYYPAEDFDEFLSLGILPIFTNTVPEDTLSAEDVKTSIEKYRISKQYPPIWNYSENNEFDYCLKCVLAPIFVAIEPNSGELYCVNELPYGDNITYTIKDLTEGSKLIDSGIVDIQNDQVMPLGKPQIISGHNYLISWSTNSGKMHENHYFTNNKELKKDDYSKLLKACGFKGAD